jgi:hypothetical protein
MKETLKKIYDFLGIETKAWNCMQMLFGKHYLGVLTIVIILVLCL